MDGNQKSSVDLDLDALQPKAVNINFKGKTISVDPLPLEQYAELIEISSEVVGAQGNDDPKLVMPLYRKLKELIDKVIPDFVDVTLNPQQILAVYELLTKLNTPEDKALAELKAQGVEMTSGGDGSPKAEASISSEQ
jgi:hypothetical protein